MTKRTENLSPAERILKATAREFKTYPEHIRASDRRLQERCIAKYIMHEAGIAITEIRKIFSETYPMDLDRSCRNVKRWIANEKSFETRINNIIAGCVIPAINVANPKKRGNNKPVPCLTNEQIAQTVFDLVTRQHLGLVLWKNYKHEEIQSARDAARLLLLADFGLSFIAPQLNDTPDVSTTVVSVASEDERDIALLALDCTSQASVYATQTRCKYPAELKAAVKH
jgi:hypothetical protein